jgi:hypothetical protein
MSCHPESFFAHGLNISSWKGRYPTVVVPNKIEMIALSVVQKGSDLKMVSSVLGVHTKSIILMSKVCFISTSLHFFELCYFFSCHQSIKCRLRMSNIYLMAEPYVDHSAVFYSWLIKQPQFLWAQWIFWHNELFRRLISSKHHTSWFSWGEAQLQGSLPSIGQPCLLHIGFFVNL